MLYYMYVPNHVVFHADFPILASTSESITTPSPDWIYWTMKRPSPVKVWW